MVCASGKLGEAGQIALELRLAALPQRRGNGGDADVTGTGYKEAGRMSDKPVINLDADERNANRIRILEQQRKERECVSAEDEQELQLPPRPKRNQEQAEDRGHGTAD